MYVKQETINTLTIEKSRFICYLKHLKNPEEFKEYIGLIRKKHYDASHICSAFICNNIKRSNDDGEPSGTAGMPILNVLEKNNLNEVGAIVVRYFGGIKLGAGGLIRAYGNAVSDCLNKAIIVEDIIYPKYRLELSYEMANKIVYFLKQQTILIDTIYNEKVCFDFAITDQEKLEKIKEYTKGISAIHIGEEIVQKVVE